MTETSALILAADEAARASERRKVIAELEGLLFSLPRPSHEIPGLYRAVELVRAMGVPGD